MPLGVILVIVIASCFGAYESYKREFVEPVMYERNHIKKLCEENELASRYYDCTPPRYGTKKFFWEKKTYEEIFKELEETK